MKKKSKLTQLKERTKSIIQIQTVNKINSFFSLIRKTVIPYAFVKMKISRFGGGFDFRRSNQRHAYLLASFYRRFRFLVIHGCINALN